MLVQRGSVPEIRSGSSLRALLRCRSGRGQARSQPPSNDSRSCPTRAQVCAGRRDVGRDQPVGMEPHVAEGRAAVGPVGLSHAGRGRARAGVFARRHRQMWHPLEAGMEGPVGAGHVFADEVAIEPFGEADGPRSYAEIRGEAVPCGRVREAVLGGAERRHACGEVVGSRSCGPPSAETSGLSVDYVLPLERRGPGRRRRRLWTLSGPCSRSGGAAVDGAVGVADLSKTAAEEGPVEAGEGGARSPAAPLRRGAAPEEAGPGPDRSGPVARPTR